MTTTKSRSGQLRPPGYEELFDIEKSGRERNSYLESFRRMLPRLESIRTSFLGEKLIELRKKYNINSDFERTGADFFDSMKDVYKVEAVAKLLGLKQKLAKRKAYKKEILVEEFINNCSTDNLKEMFFWLKNAAPTRSMRQGNKTKGKRVKSRIKVGL